MTLRISSSNRYLIRSILTRPPVVQNSHSIRGPFPHPGNEAASTAAPPSYFILCPEAKDLVLLERTWLSTRFFASSE